MVVLLCRPGQGIKERGTFRCLGVNASVLIHKDGYSFLSSFLSSFLLRCQNQPRGSLITMGFSSALGGVRRYSCWTKLLLKRMARISLPVSMIHILSRSPSWYVFHNLPLSFHLSVL